MPVAAELVNEYTALNLTCTGLGVPEVSQFKWTLGSVLLSSDVSVSCRKTQIKSLCIHYLCFETRNHYEYEVDFSDFDATFI